MTQTKRWARRLVQAVVLALLAFPVPSRAGDEGPRPNGFQTLNLRPVVNMGWKDDPKGDGPRGWTGQGDSDMRNVPPGMQNLLGIPFDLIDAAKNNGKAVLTLKSKKFSAGADSAEAVVNARAAGIYFLHASAWTSKEAMATYIVRYEDGTSVEIPIRGGEEINDWWEPQHGKQCRVALHTTNANYDNVGLLLFGWTNPHPEKPIRSLTFTSLGNDGIVVLSAVTLTDHPVRLSDPKDIVLPEYLQSDEDLIDKSQWFAVPLKKDVFEPTCIDQQSHLDAPAGRHGFQKTVDGHWVFDDGTPCRMTAVQVDIPAKKEDAAYLARFLAKYGITMVRLGHLVTGPSGSSIVDWKQPDTQQLNEKYLDQLDFFISELAKNGIYSRFTTIWYRKMKKGDNIEGFDEAVAYQQKQSKTASKAGQVELLNTCGITFFHPRVMELNIELEKALLTHQNPYRGNKMYGEDPAICQLEVTNEDGVFFWTFDGIPPVYAPMVNQLWLEWLQKKYGSDAKLAQAWGDELKDTESFASGKITRLGLFMMTDTTAAAKPHRLRDQIEFYASLQSRYFNKTKEALRQAGVRQPICGSGWFGVQNTFFADLWANTQGMDYIDRHHYYEMNYFGGKNFAAKHECALTKPEYILKLGAERVVGLPYTISEWNSQHRGTPKQYCLETAPLMAFYGNSLGGWDAPIHFAFVGTEGFSAVGFQWPVNIPSVLCQYPALSQMVRQANLKTGPDAFIRHLSEAQALSGKSQTNALIRLDISGPFGDLSSAQGANANSLAVTYAAAVGRTGILFTGQQESPDYSLDLNQYINAQKKEIRSATGELYWNFGQGYVTADAPRMQAAVGFCSNRPIKLKDCEIQTSNLIASVLVAPLDEAPLATSRHILITAIGRARNVGEYYSKGSLDRDGFRLVTPGVKPLTPCLEGVKGTVTLHHAGKCTVTALDAYGYKTVDVPAHQENGLWVIPLDGQNKAAYYEVRFE